MNKTGNLIVLSRTRAWESAIRKQDWHFNVTWALDFDDIELEAAAHPGSAAVIEFSTEVASSLISQLVDLANSPYHLRLLVVGDHEAFQWRRQLLATGVAGFFWTPTQVRLIGKLAERHFTTMTGQLQTLEERVWADLPWKPLH